MNRDEIFCTIKFKKEGNNNGNTGGNETKGREVTAKYPLSILQTIPYFKSYLHFNKTGKGETGSTYFEIIGNPDVFEQVIQIHTQDWEEFGYQKTAAIDFNKLYLLGDYLSIPTDELGEKILEKYLYQIPDHLITKNNVDYIPKMLLDFRSRKYGREVCIVYALDIDTTLITDKIHSYINDIGSFVLINEFTDVFNNWILNSDKREVDWLFQYSKIKILNDFIISHSEKFKVSPNIIGFYFFQLTGCNYIKKIKKDDEIKDMLKKWSAEKPWLGGDNGVETWLMLCCYIGFRLLEAKSQLGFFRSFDKPDVIENAAGNQWIDDSNGNINLLNTSEIETICELK